MFNNLTWKALSYISKAFWMPAFKILGFVSYTTGPLPKNSLLLQGNELLLLTVPHSSAEVIFDSFTVDMQYVKIGSIVCHTFLRSFVFRRKAFFYLAVDKQVNLQDQKDG